MDSSASHAGPSRTKQHTPHHPAGGPADGIPGVSKLKSQIRQTTRLLAKDTLDPQLRIQTERRLASLNADLAKAQTRGVEQKNGEKYHMVKFFERKKLLRIIHRTQKRLAALPAEDPAATVAPAPVAETDAKKGKKQDKKDKKDGKAAPAPAETERARLERELWEARVMLNYILHYSNLRKYIALFPAASSAGAGASTGPDDEPTASLVLPPLLSRGPDPSTLDEPSTTRLDLLRSVEVRMRTGELEAEPEQEVITGERAARGEKRKVAPVELERDAEEKVAEGESAGKKAKRATSARKRKVVAEEAPAAETDEFFE